ncbi:translation initiation factor IF-2-like [Vulpes lagopus]|uniref:translation initiation factor IF-2-like n=1 Tax=Vulpes lagopus TaxID=494514 RepID=UPI001BC8EE17|nr:translation initiation factor IF-2-like [Vulpes lagopus]
MCKCASRGRGPRALGPARAGPPAAQPARGERGAGSGARGAGAGRSRPGPHDARRDLAAAAAPGLASTAVGIARARHDSQATQAQARRPHNPTRGARPPSRRPPGTGVRGDAHGGAPRAQARGAEGADSVPRGHTPGLEGRLGRGRGRRLARALTIPPHAHNHREEMKTNHRLAHFCILRGWCYSYPPRSDEETVAQRRGETLPM